MPVEFVAFDRATPSMLPAKVDDYVPEGHLARFVVEIVGQLDLSDLTAAYSGRGSKAYHPSMMVALLFYGYATGTFSSRKLEQATYDSIAYRYICANNNPDHDSINSFRKRFLEQLEGLFEQILVTAHAMGVLKMGTVSLDGTKIKANASRRKNLNWKQIRRVEKRIRGEIKELMRRAEEAESGERPDGIDVPGELNSRRERLEALSAAKQELERRAEHRYERERKQYEEKMEERRQREERDGRKVGGRRPREPQPGPREKDKINLTDEQSRIMSVSTGGYEQSYNVQAMVDTESRMIVGRHVTHNGNDKREIEPALEQLGEVERLVEAEADNLLADAGYYSKKNVEACREHGVRPVISTRNERSRRKSAKPPEAVATKKTAVDDMKEFLETEEGRALYAMRKSTVEPMFGVIKHVLGFGQFLMRGIKAVSREWSLVCIGYNLKKMFALRTKRAGEGKNGRIDGDAHVKTDDMLPKYYAASNETIGSGCRTAPIRLICLVC